MSDPYQVKPTSAQIAAMLVRIQLASEILRTAEANARKSQGKCYFSEDGTLMNANGTRSIFDDVDE